MDSTLVSRRRERPPDYRTPSPPPYSPILSAVEVPRLDDTFTRGDVLSSGRLAGEFSDLHDHVIAYPIDYMAATNGIGRSGHRSARSMDAFASIALATQDDRSSPPKTGCTHELSFENNDTRRLRRYRSQQVAERATSMAARAEEAQLLLDFAIEARTREAASPTKSSMTASQPVATGIDFETDIQDYGGTKSALRGSEILQMSTHKATPDSNSDIAANILQCKNTPKANAHITLRDPTSSSNTFARSSNGTNNDLIAFNPRMVTHSEDLSKDLVLKPASPEEKSLSRSASEPCFSGLFTAQQVQRSHSERPARPRQASLLHSRLAPEPIAVKIPEASPAVPMDAVFKTEKPGTLVNGSSSSAVCGACNFAKNSLNIDSDYSATSWISCDGCKAWFHFACAGFKTEREVRAVDKFRCKKCKPLHGPTSYVRKSARAHASIDYAGLHQGVIKSSDDRPEHHYIAPIKNGTITFQPESFPRMSPELVTADYFEKGYGMKEPIIIPASLNPRPWQSTAYDPEHCEPSTPAPDMSINDVVSLDEWLPEESPSSVVLDDHQDGLDMVMPRDLTVRKVAQLFGLDEKIEVIDVKSQNGETRKWTTKRWADYYESKTEAKVIRNVISLEVSRSRLGRLIRRPQIVRDLDLQDSVWPDDLFNKGEFPNVQFYCLMSVADCFTDFHIDFGGSSVFYHILRGKKTFLFIPPKEKHLKKYEEWCKSPAQNWTFLPDQTKECYRVDLVEGDTMLIPSGWIHAVWTPEDSLVIGGNFLTRMSYSMQFRVHQLEKATGVARKFRYPHFQKLHWFAVFQYLDTDPLPLEVRSHLEGGYSFRRDVPTANEFNEWGENSRAGVTSYNARYYSQAELDGLPELVRYILRTVLIDSGLITDGISAEVRNAVKRSIPRNHGHPAEIVKTFAIWCTWKRGNEPIPHWAYPDSPISSAAASEKTSTAITRKMAEEAAAKAPRRQSQRMQALKEAEEGVSRKNDQTVSDSRSANLSPAHPTASDGVASTVKRRFEQSEDCNTDESASPASKRFRTSIGGTGNQRKTACDACRRRRRACKHKEEIEWEAGTVMAEILPSNLVHREALANGNALQHKLSSLGGLFSALRSDSQQNIPSTSETPHGCDTAAQPHESESALIAHGSSAVPPPHDDDASGDASVNSEHGTGPKPRTKACNHCRKSKVWISSEMGSDHADNNQRRCIHDAFGNEDPAKVAESAVPRPHARKIKGDLSSRTSGASPEFDRAYLPDIFDELAPPITLTAESALEGSDRKILATGEVDANQLQSPSQRISQQRPIELSGNNGGYTSFANEAGQKVQMTQDGQAVTGIYTSQRDSRSDIHDQAASSLVSPPESSDDVSASSPSNAAHVRSGSRSRGGSPPTSRHFHSRTPESGPIGKSELSPAQSKHLEQGSSSFSKRRSTSVPEADEESLRLIKELQAQDLGLRRRGRGGI